MSYLFIGGPLHGQYRSVESLTRYKVPIMNKLSLIDDEFFTSPDSYSTIDYEPRRIVDDITRCMTIVFVLVGMSNNEALPHAAQSLAPIRYDL